MTGTRGGNPRLFIGSSGEGRAVAEALRRNLEREIATEVWSQGLFGISSAAVECLDGVSRGFDFAALVVSPGDVAESRTEARLSPRDDVIFEAGLFMGRLGRERTFLVHAKDAEIELPSELAGLSVVRYREHGHANLETALAPVAARLRAAIRKFKEYRPVLRPADLERDRADRPLLARPRRTSSVGTASAHGPRQVMRIVNLSVTGALLESPGELPVGQILDLDLALDDRAPIRVTARVVRVQFPDWGRVGGVGVAFTGVAPGQREELEKFVEGGREAA